MRTTHPHGEADATARRFVSTQRWCLASVALVAVLITPGCFTMTHTMGDKVEDRGELSTLGEEKQWFAGWGVVPMNPVDTHELSEGESYYEVTTTFTPFDVLISSITSFFGFYRQTIRVEG